ncbi:hypothetical protein HU200_015738 [Digitaria exilis]|uniref:2,4-dihydroxy-7-methoxy-2H-1,4-benzoxazin-3(4H)-one 2-D-glucosyltransferase n=1 Tax=Digitaria exilis TaxID=1010633 RepID=A0A835KIR6_9POAL|nr:hypothetical protein HU200_015738 [Digitaria exilis]
MGSTSTGATAIADDRRRRRVLFFPLPYQGHINPMFQLAGVLHSRGFAITVFHTHFNAPDASFHPDYHFVLVSGDVMSPTPADSPDTVQATVEHILAVNRSCEAPFRHLLAVLLARRLWLPVPEQEEEEEDDVACLVADAHLLTLLDVARELGVPTMALRTGSAACFRFFTAFPLLCDKGYLPAHESSSELDAAVVELPPYRVGDLPSARSAAAHVQMGEVISRAVTAVATSTGLILNTFDALEASELASLRRDRDLAGVQVFDVGPLHKLSPATSSSLLHPDRSCLDWLDAQPQRSVLYVSFGSLASMSSSDVEETAWGIAGSSVRFLWVLRPGIVSGAGAPPPLPDVLDAAVAGGRGVVVRWAPQEEVLAHAAVGAFWTHCGWNSTVEAVCAGVPMLCTPCFGDQMGNARYVVDVWRNGLMLAGGEVERGKVADAIAAVMGEGGEEVRRRAMELKSSAAESIGEAGSSSIMVDKLVSHIQSL